MSQADREFTGGCWTGRAPGTWPRTTLIIAKVMFRSQITMTLPEAGKPTKALARSTG